MARLPRCRFYREGIDLIRMLGDFTHMRIRPFFCSPWIVVFCAIISSASCRGAESQTPTNASFKSSAPTGVYVSATPVGGFTVRLDASGDYLVSAESLVPGGNQNQKGRWVWNAQRREFLLTPNTTVNGHFQFEFRRLRVDKHEPDTLQWIPLHGVRTSAGTIEYVRLKREKG